MSGYRFWLRYFGYILKCLINHPSVRHTEKKR